MSFGIAVLAHDLDWIWRDFVYAAWIIGVNRVGARHRRERGSWA